jgi:hypothetical protein
MDSFASPEKFKSSDSLNLEYNMWYLCFFSVLLSVHTFT